MSYKKEVIVLFSILFIIVSFLIIYKPSIIGYVTTFEVSVPNSPPNLITSIPDQTWSIDTANNDAFDLDNYLSDPNLDPLIYTITGNSSITVEINSSTNMISFSQPPGWTGTEYVIFNATDDDGKSVESNNVALTVTSAPTPPPTSTGPGGAAVGPAPTPPPKPPTPVKIKEKIFYIEFTVEDERMLMVSKEDLVMMTFDGMIWYRASIEKVTESSVMFIIQPATPITVNLKIGETKEVDINEDRIGDVSITLISIKDGTAKLRFKELAGGVIIIKEKLLFGVGVEILPNYQSVFAGDSIIAKIKIYNLSATAEMIGVRVDYFIKDLKESLVSYEYEIKTVENQIEYAKEITLPEDLELGKYVLEVQVIHGDKIALNSTTFEVIKKSILKKILIFIILILIIITTAFAAYKKRKYYYKKIWRSVRIIKCIVRIIKRIVQ